MPWPVSHEGNQVSKTIEVFWFCRHFLVEDRANLFNNINVFYFVVAANIVGRSWFAALHGG